MVFAETDISRHALQIQVFRIVFVDIVKQIVEFFNMLLAVGNVKIRKELLLINMIVADQGSKVKKQGTDRQLSKLRLAEIFVPDTDQNMSDIIINLGISLPGHVWLL